MIRSTQGKVSFSNVLLVAFFSVIMFGIIIGFGYSFAIIGSEDAPNTSFEIEEDGDQLIAIHNGGDSIEAEKLDVVNADDWDTSGTTLTRGDTIAMTPNADDTQIEIKWSSGPTEITLAAASPSDFE